MKLSGNTILVTGGTSGIGLELAARLIEMGNTVLVTGRNAAALAATKKQLPKVHTFQSDVGDAAAIPVLYEKVASAFPALNMVINNAGIMREINLNSPQSDLDRLVEEIEINLCGTIRVTTTFLPLLKKQPAAAIMNVSSGLAFVPLPTSPVYCATKAAVHSFTLSLRAQLKSSHVKVFELAPPATQTPLLASSKEEDMKGITIMPVADMVRAAIRGMEKDQFEIRPGQSNALKLMSRIAPQFILNQLSKPVDNMLARDGA